MRKNDLLKVRMIKKQRFNITTTNWTNTITWDLKWMLWRNKTEWRNNRTNDVTKSQKMTLSWWWRSKLYGFPWLWMEIPTLKHIAPPSKPQTDKQNHDHSTITDTRYFIFTLNPLVFSSSFVLNVTITKLTKTHKNTCIYQIHRNGLIWANHTKLNRTKRDHRNANKLKSNKGRRPKQS